MVFCDVSFSGKIARERSRAVTSKLNTRKEHHLYSKAFTSDQQYRVNRQQAFNFVHFTAQENGTTLHTCMTFLMYMILKGIGPFNAHAQ